MRTAPTPSREETRANATFEALIWSMSRPGRLRDLPERGEAQIIEALIDRECHVFCADPLLMPKVLETGARIAALAGADHVFLGMLTDLDGLKSLSTGSDLYPDGGASVVIRARLGEGSRLRLTGPGIETEECVHIGGVPDGFWSLRRDLIQYPMGFDVFFIDGARVLGLPRSTKVEML
ncbi:MULTISPECIES: phosphonate C-P lyase system protein PhnH [Roseobacteraceae]|uniref:phosphonate C-P lyase system protein PhnH n=1 Tax=Roseobacteraceae TaxID=2854170 RepID=UPI00125EB3B6|nr:MULTISPECIES: phosphonate C-P lyase system protein PhnH [Roseobacteraceae]KAB6715617.1 phosphonate C-P lyase system protein PhnH [Roseobacter sp. TSBP12]|tara:strand:+ start:1969 stop:2505 length:537 start_codon:yes stop_codon:yes gene_type:complete